MRFNIVLLGLGLFNLAAAVPTPDTAETAEVAAPQELPIEAAYRRAGTLLADLDRQLHGFRNIQGNIAQRVEQDLRRAFDVQQQIVQELNYGAQGIRRGDNIGAWTAAMRMDWANAFNDLMVRTMNGWGDARRVIDHFNRGSDIGRSLSLFRSATMDFHDALTLRIPSLIRNSCQSAKAIQTRAIEDVLRFWRRW
jgi:hypothetical protein